MVGPEQGMKGEEDGGREGDGGWELPATSYSLDRIT